MKTLDSLTATDAQFRLGWYAAERQRSGVRPFILGFTIGFLFAFLILMSGCRIQPVTNGIPNFALVDAGFYRGGQPDKEGLKWLLQHEHDQNGQFMVLKLNTDKEGPADAVPYGEGCSVEGCNIIYFPITIEQQIGIEPIDMGILRVLIQYLPHYGTLIHCSHGEDRTGLAVAMHRVLVDGWSKADAEKEMLAHGFHKELVGLWRAWQEFKP